MGQTIGAPWGEEDPDYKRSQRRINQIGHRGTACRHLTLLAPTSMERTAFMQRIAYDIRSGKIETLKKDVIVIVLDFNTFDCKEKTEPSNVILGHLFPDKHDPMMIKSFEWMIRHASRIVFVIYTLHSVPFDLQRKRPLIDYFKTTTADVVLFNVLSGHLFPGARILSSHDSVKMENLHHGIQPDHCIALEGLNKESSVKLVVSLQKELGHNQGGGLELPDFSTEEGIVQAFGATKTVDGSSFIFSAPKDMDRKREILLEHLINKVHTECNEERRLELFVSLCEGREGSIPVIREVKDIDVSEVIMGRHDSYSIGFIMKHSLYLKSVNLRRCGLNDSKLELISEAVLESYLQVRELQVSGNYFGVNGINSLAKIVKHCRVKILIMWSCALESQHLQRLLDSTDGVAMDMLDMSSNSFGVDGMLRLGKAVKQWGLKFLELQNCSLEGRHLKKLFEGMGGSQLYYLNLNEWHDNPQFTPELLSLLPLVTEEMNLRGWAINEKQRAKLQKKLNQMGPNHLRIYLSGGIRLQPRHLA